MDALTTPNKTLFLSYSRKQASWCDDLYYAIDRHTHYYRWRDNKIPESADWWSSICLNIEGCFAFIAILTEDYLESGYCISELEYALKLNKPVIALMLEDIKYPQKLNEMRVQFSQVDGLNMTEVINKVLKATNQIVIDYTQSKYSLDISSRSELRPDMPNAFSSSYAVESDAHLGEYIREYRTHGQIHTPDLIMRFYEEKEKQTNIKLAWDLLKRIANRNNKPDTFDVEAEREELKQIEARVKKSKQAQQEQDRIETAYAELARHVETVSSKLAIEAIKNFMTQYPNFGDPDQLMRRFLPSSNSLIPEPFGWISLRKRNFSIAKYPVTNAQFQQFIVAGGYDDQIWWTKQGWEIRQREGWIEPRYWDSSSLNGDIQPVVGVSWYEAIAFCSWMSNRTRERIMLPTEEQWQYAAEGDNQLAYPWGSSWDSSKCHNSVGGRARKTSIVTQYEGKGNRPFDAVDMAGNVWEWCLTDYDTGINNVNNRTGSRVMRGGSWREKKPEEFRCDYRHSVMPHFRNRDYGFRLVRN